VSTSATPQIDLSEPLCVHVVGVGGAGMSAIAAVLAGMGHHTTGSDIKSSRSLERLGARGVEVEIGHRPENVAGADVLTYSTAVSENNVELRQARRLGIPVLSRAAMLEAIVALRRTIAIAGTHGKTTTSSMLALVLVEAGLRPSFIIGGEVNEIGTNAAWDSGELLVVEADESDGTFLHMAPELGIVTSVEPDHIEHYGSFEELKAAFEVFLAQAGSAIVCADDPVAASLAPASAVTYGCSQAAKVRIVGVESGRNHLRFELVRSAESLGVFELPVPGLHNARNATAAVSAALELGVDPSHARRALARFAGVARRFEFRGDFGGVTFVDDYAHLPGEVRAALDAALGGNFERVVCVFQPHRYSRVAMLAPGFADSFDGAGLVVVTDVYSAGEMPRPGVSGKLVLDAILRAHPEAAAVYVPNREGVVAYLRTNLRPGDLCLTLAAGDLTNLASELGAEFGESDRP
jgi:UDP-N-acetylmuramate--alanine ligase